MLFPDLLSDLQHTNEQSSEFMLSVSDARKSKSLNMCVWSKISISAGAAKGAWY